LEKSSAAKTAKVAERPAKTGGDKPDSDKASSDKNDAAATTAAANIQPQPDANAQVAAAAPSEQAGCQQGNWPYVDRGCADADTNSGQATKSMRVISTDRTAPSGIVTTTVPQEVATDAAVAHAAAEPQIDAVPLPKPKPEQIVREKVATPREPASSAEVVRSDGESPAAMPAAPEHKRKEVKLASPARGDAKRSRHAERTVETARSTASEMDPEDVDPEDDDGFTPVRAYRLPDGRRVTIYRKYEEERADRVLRGDTYTVRRVYLNPRREGVNGSSESRGSAARPFEAGRRLLSEGP